MITTVRLHTGQNGTLEVLKWRFLTSVTFYQYMVEAALSLMVEAITQGVIHLHFTYFPTYCTLVCGVMSLYLFTCAFVFLLTVSFIVVQVSHIFRFISCIVMH